MSHHLSRWDSNDEGFTLSFLGGKKSSLRKISRSLLVDQRKKVFPHSYAIQ